MNGSAGMTWITVWPNSSNRCNVRFGSKADMATSPRDVRFTPESGHQCAAADRVPARRFWRAGKGARCCFAVVVY